MSSTTLPSPLEIQRKLSGHVPRRKLSGPVSGTESDSDSGLPQDAQSTGLGPSVIVTNTASAMTQPPLTSIAERRSQSGDDDSEDEEDDVHGGWRTPEVRGVRNSLDEGVIKAGYLWKKGERRKTWKKRWFVLRPAHLAYYKSSKEYQLLRLLELCEVHSCTQVNLKRHDNTFGLISPTRTFYLQAANGQDLQSWVQAIENARQTLEATSTRNSVSTPVQVPAAKTAVRSTSRGSIPLSSSPSGSQGIHHALTSSDSEDATSPIQSTFPIPPSRSAPPVSKDPTKIIMSGYLMKCGSKRRNWRKRWFVLTAEKLVYSGSHMDTKPHRVFPFNDILDALEYELPPSHHKSTGGQSASPPNHDADDPHSKHTFKIVTTKRTLLVCAPTEDDEIRWLGAIRALIVRRLDSGQVPGRIAAPKSTVAATSGQQAESVSPTTGGIKSKVRRLSGAGHHRQTSEEIKSV